MFEQDVAGLIKALRANKDDEGKVIQQALDETRKEIKSKDLEVKAAAILKLVYVRAGRLRRALTAAARDARDLDCLCLVCHRRVHVVGQVPHQGDRVPRRVTVLRPRDGSRGARRQSRQKGGRLELEPC